jgi:hypothetical protein
MYIEPGQKIRIPEPNRAFEIVNMLTDIQEERL